MSAFDCYPRAVSIVTGIDCDTLFQVLGHDGSKYVRHYTGAAWYAGFTTPEMHLALLRLGWCAVSLPSLLCDGDLVPVETYPQHPDIEREIFKHTDSFILVGNKRPGRLHCWAYKDGLVIDPYDGSTYDQLPAKYPVSLYEFYLRYDREKSPKEE